MTDKTTAEREAFIRWHMDYLHTDDMLAAHVWDNRHLLAAAWQARASLPLPGAQEAVAPLPAAVPVALPDEKTCVDYALQYGGNCRDCADENGVCPGSGLPCDGARKAVTHVVQALRYGLQHGYLAAPQPALSAGWVMVPLVPTQDMVNAAKFGVDGRLSVFKWADGYYAMLAAAPLPPSPSMDGESNG